MQTHKINTDALNTLLTRNRDAARGFEEAAKSVNDRGFRKWLNDNASLRQRFAVDLEREIRRAGDNPEKGTSFLADLHRTWMDWSSDIIDRPEEFIAEECIRGEEKALEDFQEVLKEENFPLSITKLLNEQMNDILNNLNALRAIEAAFDEVEA